MTEDVNVYDAIEWADKDRKNLRTGDILLDKTSAHGGVVDDHFALLISPKGVRTNIHYTLLSQPPDIGGGREEIIMRMRHSPGDAGTANKVLHDSMRRFFISEVGYQKGKRLTLTAFGFTSTDVEERAGIYEINAYIDRFGAPGS